MVILFSVDEDDDNERDDGDDDEDNEDDFGSDSHRASIYGDDEYILFSGKIYPHKPAR